MIKNTRYQYIICDGQQIDIYRGTEAEIVQNLAQFDPATHRADGVQQVMEEYERWVEGEAPTTFAEMAEQLSCFNEDCGDYLDIWYTVRIDEI